MAAWIKMIGDAEAGPALSAALDRARTPHGTVDNVMRVHSLRPNTMHGHVTLYRAALHDDGNTLPTWLQETRDCASQYGGPIKITTLIESHIVRAEHPIRRS